MSFRFTSIIRLLPFLFMATPGHAQTADPSGIEFSTEEYAYIDQLRENGGLKVSVVPGPGAGFHYRFLLAFSDFISVPVITRENSIRDYFLKDGVLPEGYRTDATIVYTPDIFAELDLLANGLTINDWRQKFIAFVPIFPVKILLITRKGEEIQNITDLAGKTIATVEAFSYTDLFQKLDAEQNLELDYIFVENSDRMFESVSGGDAFAMAADSDASIVNINVYQNLNISQPLADIEFLGWGVRKDNNLLASIIEKYTEYAKLEGSFNEIWRAEYGIDFNDYLRILEY